MNVAMYSAHCCDCVTMFNWHLQNAVFCVLFAIGFFAGGVASAVNSANFRDDYYNEDIQDACEQIRDNDSSDDYLVELCDDIEALLRALSNAAVSS